VLTIFEYLRKRARESVMAGVQDAVEYLDGKSTDVASTASPEKTATTISTATPEPQPFDAQKYLAIPGPTNGATTPALPPPRRRGRPRKQGEST
jgi:hypothetical protein